MGAFKFRGAYNRLAQLDAAARERGVVAFSSGNHAQGVALAAQLLGIGGDDRDADRRAGGEARRHARLRRRGRPLRPLTRIATRSPRGVAGERGATLVPPYDDPAVIAGAGHDGARADRGRRAARRAVRVPAAAAGCSRAARSRRPRSRPGSRSAASSRPGRRRLGAVAGARRAGDDPGAGHDRRRDADAVARRADVSDRPGAVRRRRHGDATTRSCDAMRFAFERLKLVIEPSGAAALAAVLVRKASTCAAGASA